MIIVVPLVAEVQVGTTILSSSVPTSMKDLCLAAVNTGSARIDF